MKKKKTILITLSVILLITVTTFTYLYIINSPEEQGAQDRQPTDDQLAKSELEGIEENINGFNIEDDLTITRMTQRQEGGLQALGQQEVDVILENIGEKSGNTVLHQFNASLPAAINKSLQYWLYNISFDYFLVTNEEGANLRQNPLPGATVVGWVENLDKVSLLQRVEGEEIAGSDIWYRVVSAAENQVNEGYLHSSTGISRHFRFEKMQNAVNELRELLAQGELHFISNYKNHNGTPPGMGIIAVDEFGYRVYHSAPAYYQANTEADYRYVPDGMLVRILDEVGDFYYVNIPTFQGDFYVPVQYIDPADSLHNLNHVVVIDRQQQNQAAFEISDNSLDLVSYTLATTGIAGDFSFETSPGSYKALAKRIRFEYLKDGTEEIAGYAPFATRFSGGAYIHGVPVAYVEEDGEMIDPGKIEYLHTIGTFPRSSMCVRNFTSHAEFLYNWMDVENGAVLVME